MSYESYFSFSPVPETTDSVRKQRKLTCTCASIIAEKLHVQT